MKREEAIKTLRELWRETNDSWYEEVYDMAIEALTQDSRKVTQESDLISREDAREAIDKLMEIHFDRKVVLSKARDVIVSLPSAEAVEIVRCKDCKHQDHCHETVAHTKKHDEFIEYWSEPIEWCSRGERKGGDDE